MVELAWGVEVSSWCRVGVEVWCRGVEARAQAESILSRRAWRDLLARLGRVRVRDPLGSPVLIYYLSPNDLLFLRRDFPLLAFPRAP